MPVYLIFVVIMIPLSVAAYYYNKILGIIGLSVSLIALAAILALTIRFRFYVKEVVHSAMEECFTPDQKGLDSMKTPVAVCGEHGELLPWAHIDVGVSDAFLIREHERAYEGLTTPDCRTICSGCGANVFLGRACDG